MGRWLVEGVDRMCGEIKKASPLVVQVKQKRACGGTLRWGAVRRLRV